MCVCEVALTQSPRPGTIREEIESCSVHFYFLIGNGGHSSYGRCPVDQGLPTFLLPRTGTVPGVGGAAVAAHQL